MGVPGAPGDHADGIATARSLAACSAREAMVAGARRARSALCAQMAYASQGAQPTCIDYAAWTAIAGDHSCSAREMLGVVLDSRWILRVARVGARLKVRLTTATRRDRRTNA